MGRFFRDLVATSAGLLLAFILKTIFGVEIEEFWNSYVQPHISAHAWSWVAIMLSWLSTFWGGAVVTLVALLLVDRVGAMIGLHRIKPASPDNATAVELTSLKEVAAEALARVRNTDVHIPFSYGAQGTSNELRRMADLITKWHDVFGRIPNTEALQTIKAGSYFTSLTADGELVAVEHPSSGNIAFVDLSVRSLDRDEIISTVVKRTSDALELEA